jgi:cyclic pyranopterin phosphate synthase
VTTAPSPFTHLTATGEARMVDVSAKPVTVRAARARATVTCAGATIAAIRGGAAPKGDVLAVARLAGIAGAKRVPELLPLAHVIGLHAAQVDLELRADSVVVTAEVRAADRTGVEMEALTAATVAALALIDMVKGMDRGAAIAECLVTHKSGGRSGEWTRPGFETA